MRSLVVYRAKPPCGLYKGGYRTKNETIYYSKNRRDYLSPLSTELKDAQVAIKERVTKEIFLHR